MHTNVQICLRYAWYGCFLHNFTITNYSKVKITFFLSVDKRQVTITDDRCWISLVSVRNKNIFLPSRNRWLIIYLFTTLRILYIDKAKVWEKSHERNRIAKQKRFSHSVIVANLWMCFFFVISWTFDILAKSSSNIVSFMFKQIYVLLSTLINIQTYVSLVLELFVKTNTQIHTHIQKIFTKLSTHNAQSKLL